MTTEWPEALDRFERQLDHYRAVLERGADPVTTRWPPDDLTSAPIPVELVPRARALLAAARELERRLDATRAALPVHPTHHHRQRPFVGRPTISAEL